MCLQLTSININVYLSGISPKNPQDRGSYTNITILGHCLRHLERGDKAEIGRANKLHQALVRLQEAQVVISNGETLTCVRVAGYSCGGYRIDLASKTKQLNHWIHLNTEFRADLLWWDTFLTLWNGCSLLEAHNPNW